MTILELKAEAEAVLKTLPLAHYLRTSTIPVTFDETARTSYFDPSNFRIVVSFANVFANAKNSHPKTAEDTEKIVRGFLYHEVSHAVLTPSQLMQYASYLSIKCSKDYLITPRLANIAEDERIETLLQGYYLNTNFKQNLNATCPLEKGDSFASFEGYCFNAIRHRYAPLDGKAVNEEVKAFVKATKEINAQSYAGDLVEAIEVLLKDLKGRFDTLMAMLPKTAKATESGKGEKAEGSEQPNEGKNTEETHEGKQPEESENPESESESEPEEGEEAEEASDSEKEPKEGKGKAKEAEEDKQPEETAEEAKIKELEDDSEPEETEEGETLTAKEMEAVAGLMAKAMLKALERADRANGRAIKLSDFIADKEAKTEMLKIIGRNSGFGKETAPVINGYSGKFSPKRLMTDFNDTRKWFTKKSYEATGIAGKKATIRTLNIWLDNSGSYSNNDEATNAILKALQEIEKARTDFRFNLIRFGTNFYIEKGEERISNSRWDNALPKDEIARTYKEVNPKGNEVNIMLFDGEATRNRGNDSYASLKPFNNSRSIFITERSNLEGIKSNCGQAREIIEVNYNYAKSLATNIVHALDMLF